MKLNPNTTDASRPTAEMPTKPAGIHAPTWRGSAWAIGAMAVGIAIGGTGVALAALPATSSATAPAW